jgi:hypothetical protein
VSVFRHIGFNSLRSTRLLISGVYMMEEKTYVFKITFDDGTSTEHRARLESYTHSRKEGWSFLGMILGGNPFGDKVKSIEYLRTE